MRAATPSCAKFPGGHTRRQDFGEAGSRLRKIDAIPWFLYTYSVPLPEFIESGDLPRGIHTATLEEVVTRFGSDSPRRRVLGARLQRIHALAFGTGHLARFVLFGSFVTDKPDPNDIDIFMIMDDAFHVGELERETKILFDHLSAQSYFGASIFWVRRLAALGGETEAIQHWQSKRDGNLRGIIEVLP